jgi:hypothetical protein
MEKRQSIEEMAVAEEQRAKEYNEQTGGRLLVPSREFMKSFWDEKIAWKDDPETIRVNHCHYRIGPEDPNFYSRGFGGAKFVFERLDTGERIVSTNVWYQGEIPTDYDDILPDNARVITE